jgi:hypothetical protein
MQCAPERCRRRVRMPGFLGSAFSFRSRANSTASSLVAAGRAPVPISSRSTQFRNVAGLIPSTAPAARRAVSFDSPRRPAGPDTSSPREPSSPRRTSSAPTPVSVSLLDQRPRPGTPVAHTAPSACCSPTGPTRSTPRPRSDTSWDGWRSNTVASSCRTWPTSWWSSWPRRTLRWRSRTSTRGTRRARLTPVTALHRRPPGRPGRHSTCASPHVLVAIGGVARPPPQDPTLAPPRLGSSGRGSYVTRAGRDRIGQTASALARSRLGRVHLARVATVSTTHFGHNSDTRSGARGVRLSVCLDAEVAVDTVDHRFYPCLHHSKSGRDGSVGRQLHRVDSRLLPQHRSLGRRIACADGWMITQTRYSDE